MRAVFYVESGTVYDPVTGEPPVSQTVEVPVWVRIRTHTIGDTSDASTRRKTTGTISDAEQASVGKWVETMGIYVPRAEFPLVAKAGQRVLVNGDRFVITSIDLSLDYKRWEIGLGR